MDGQLLVGGELFRIMDSLEAAGDRFDEALNQMQKSLDTVNERVTVALRRSEEDLCAANDEIIRLKNAFADLQRKHDDLRSVAGVVSTRIDHATVKVRSLLEG